MYRTGIEMKEREREMNEWLDWMKDWKGKLHWNQSKRLLFFQSSWVGRSWRGWLVWDGERRKGRTMVPDGT